MTPRKSEAITKVAEAMRDQTLRLRVLRTGNIPGEGDFSFRGEGFMRGDGSRASLKGELVDVNDDEFEVEVRIDGRETWTGGPDFEGFLPAGASWIHTDEVLSVDRAIVPWFMADLLEETYDVDEMGEKRVEGVAATHYRGVADVWPLREKIPEFAAMGRQGERVPVDVWIADGRPKRLRLDYNAGNLGLFVDAVVLGYGDAQIPGPPPEKDVVDARRLKR